MLSVHPVPNPALTGLARGENVLWTADASSGRIFELSPNPPYPLKRAYRSPGGAPHALFWDGTYLWTADRKTETIYQHTVGSSLRSVAEYGLSGVRVAGLYRAGDRLWVLDAASKKLDAYRIGRRLERLESWDLSSALSAGAEITGCAMDEDSVWVVTENPAELHEFNRAARLGTSRRL